MIGFVGFVGFTRFSNNLTRSIAVYNNYCFNFIALEKSDKF